MKFDNFGDKFENPEPGSHLAVLTRIIDMGHQEIKSQGTIKVTPKVKLGWELDTKMKDGRPFLVYQDFTKSMYDNAFLRKFIEGWRAEKYNNETLRSFDIKKLLGQGCMLNMVQNGDYVNVSSASKLPKGVNPPEPVNGLIYVSLDEFVQEEFDKLSQKIQDKIKASPEYKSLFEGKKEDESIEEDITF